MSCKCTNCGEDTSGEFGLPGKSCRNCGTSCTPKRYPKKTVRSCEPIPTGVHPVGCGCQPCYESRKYATVYKTKSCLTSGGVDPDGLEAFDCPKPVECKAPNNCQPFTKDSFARINRTFAFPAQGAVARTEILNVALAEGQPITNENYGTLIVHPVWGEENFGLYDLENPLVANNGLDVIGKPVPCGMEFYFGYPQCECTVDEIETLECNALLEDFIVPAIGETAEAVVISYLGLSIDSKVTIRNKVDPNLIYTFRVSGATGSNTLILENEGDGGVEGVTYTAASDVEGEYAWCVSPFEDQNPCLQAADTLCITHLLGCDENGSLRKIQGEIENQALVYDPDCGGYTNKVVPKTVVCVLLDSCFQIAPVEDICNRTWITITTLEDQKLLDEATDALLSDNANPLITICGYTFSLDLVASVVGALVVIPDFNPTEIISFDKNCKVCIPEDCCFQCNPQVRYPVEAYFPPGKSDALTVVIPAALTPTVGEYKFSVVKNAAGDTNYLFVHDNVTNEVTAAYDQSGAPLVLGDLPGDPNEYAYNTFDFCNTNTTCPVDAQYEEDINLAIYDMVLGEQIAFNYHTEFDIYNCDRVGSGEALLTTQYGIMGNFTGPTHTSGIAFGGEPFGQIAPEPDGFKIYEAISNYKKRTFALFYPTCVRVITLATILMRVTEEWENITDDWIYASTTTITIPAGGLTKYVAGQSVKVHGEGVNASASTVITLVADTLLTVADAVIPNAKLHEKYVFTPRKNKILQLGSTSMFRVQII